MGSNGSSPPEVVVLLEEDRRKAAWDPPKGGKTGMGLEWSWLEGTHRTNRRPENMPRGSLYKIIKPKTSDGNREFTRFSSGIPVREDE